MSEILSLVSLFFVLLQVVRSDICLGFLGYTLRSQYGDENNSFSVYDLQLTNTGSCEITGAILYIGNLDVTISESWNVQPTEDGRYLIFNNLPVVDFQYTGAGLIANYNGSITNGDPQLSIHYLSCSSCGFNSDPNAPSFDVSVFSALGDLLGPPSASITVPPNFKLIGGGLDYDATGLTGYQLSQSYPSDSFTWVVNTKNITANQGPQRMRVYAVALYDPSDDFDVEILESIFVGIGQQNASVFVNVNDTYAVAGGGAISDQFLVANYPFEELGVKGWRASFVSNPLVEGDVSSTGMKAYAIAIRSNNPSYTVSSEPIGNVAISPVPSTQTLFTSQSSSLPGYETMVMGGFLVTDALVQSSYPLSPVVNNGLFVWSVSALNYDLNDTSPSLVVYGLGLSISSSDVNNLDNIQPPNCGCHASLDQSLVSSWDDGAQFSVTITNDGAEDIYNIGFYSQTPNSIVSIWAVHETSYSYNGIVSNVFTQPTYLGVIPPGDSFQFGFLATNSSVEFSIVYVSCIDEGQFENLC